LSARAGEHALIIAVLPGGTSEDTLVRAVLSTRAGQYPCVSVVTLATLRAATLAYNAIWLPCGIRLVCTRTAGRTGASTAENTTIVGSTIRIGGVGHRGASSGRIAARGWAAARQNTVRRASLIPLVVWCRRISA
jgi:hypothetical protein